MKPQLLIASPQMKDPFFERAVLLLWHHDEDGAIGVVINRPLEHALPDVLAVDDPIDLDPYAESLVSWGGPVELGSGTVLTRAPLREDEGWSLQGNVHVSRSQEVLLRLLREQAEVLLCLGYAGWGPGQLDQEITEGSWLWTDPDAHLVFDVPHEARYEEALATLGLTPAMAWMAPVFE